MKTDVSFVILSYNDSELVLNAIKSIKKLKTNYKFDIFVVDNGSKDNSPEKIEKKFKDVNVIKLDKNIGTAAYDKAIAHSKSKYIFFTGCDIEAKEDMLDKLVDFLEENEGVVQAAPKYINYFDRNKIDLAGTWLSRSFYSGTFKDDTLGDSPVEIPYIGTGLIRRRFIDNFGYLFDNDYFFYGEDVDLGLRIHLLGCKVYYIPDSIVYHRGSQSRRVHKHAYLTFLMERNLLRTFFHTMSWKGIILYKPYVMLMRLLAIIKDIFTLHFGMAFARIKAISWAIFNFNNIMAKRKKIQSMRIAEDSQLEKYFSEKHVFK